MSRVFLVYVALCVFACRAARLKIINGEFADIKDFPYMASLQYNGSFFGHKYDHFCCGSIISNKWIITSAQCAQARDTDEFHVRVGSSKYYEGGIVYKVAKTLIHPKFNQMNYDYDVGLLKLTKKIEFTQNVKAINLPEINRFIDGSTNLSIAGWGATQLLGPISDNLYESHIQKISDESCQVFYGTESVTDRMFCAFTEGFGPCVGDSGSPAVLDNQIIGVVSWTYGCAYVNPTVYMKVISALDWIIVTTMHENEDSLVE